MNTYTNMSDALATQLSITARAELEIRNLKKQLKAKQKVIDMQTDSIRIKDDKIEDLYVAIKEANTKPVEVSMLDKKYIDIYRHNQ